jgi:hypothetical protein
MIRESTFGLHRSPRRLNVVPADIAKPVVSVLAEPHVKRHRPATTIIRQTLERFQVRVLYDIRGINAAADPRIEPQVDESPQLGPMSLDKPIERRTVSEPRLLQEPQCFRRVVCCVSHYRIITHIAKPEPTAANEKSCAVGQLSFAVPTLNLREVG